MKKRYAISISLALVFLIIGMFVFNSNKIDYANFYDAKKNGKIVQVIGKPEKNNNIAENSTSKFIFRLTDKTGKTETVEYMGPKPMNFDLAEFVVIKGKYENNKFIAKEILTKCPSKYENEITKRQGEK